MFKKFWILPIVAITGLSACLDTDLERGFAGAAAGALTADILGADPIVGAALGGTAGVVCDDMRVSACQ
ncbi:hypothetical protein BVC71_10935 [Marivivens niveibacter]|uniref:YMGG-like Gly-zipper domain-containing protein n=1 Tax=Marivivens niveibacter TaxID=1930667 RepID=A0A251WYK0_9RHOB|nr:hypothetical protein [Marivivens niveibacter]OUD09208.1 hypothetical protein BVC71_10935 [Marivivens niveibacter]